MPELTIWYLGDAIRNYMWEPSSFSMQDQVQGLRLPALKEFGMTTRYVACLIHFRSSSSLKTYLSTFCSDSIGIAVTEGGSQISTSSEDFFQKCKRISLSSFQKKQSILIASPRVKDLFEFTQV
ncbi:hypothetical protein ACJX0J_000405, partial (mitochondrion) [Zea mays]